MKEWILKRTKQCSKCPWRTDVNPYDIPNGYSAEKHCALKSTIAKGVDSSDIGGVIRVMACHETHSSHCVGWLVNQLGPGNNIPLRVHIMSCMNVGDIETIGEQYETFEEMVTNSIVFTKSKEKQL